jgi:hypothetical protein
MDRETGDVIKQWAIPFAIAAGAGLVNYLQRFTQEPTPKWSWMVATVKVLTAGFVGMLTGWLLSGWNVPQTYVYFAMGVAGYGGGETIVFFQQVFQDTISRYARKDSDRP